MYTLKDVYWWLSITMVNILSPDLKDPTLLKSYIGYNAFTDSLIVSGDNKNLSLNFNLNYTTIEGNEAVLSLPKQGSMDAINKQLNAKSSQYYFI